MGPVYNRITGSIFTSTGVKGNLQIPEDYLTWDTFEKTDDRKILSSDPNI